MTWTSTFHSATTNPHETLEHHNSVGSSDSGSDDSKLQIDKALRTVSATSHKPESHNHNPHPSLRRSFAHGTLLTRRESCTNQMLAREKPPTPLPHQENPNPNPGSSSDHAFDVQLALRARRLPSHLMLQLSVEQKERHSCRLYSKKSRTIPHLLAHQAHQVLSTVNNLHATPLRRDHPARLDTDHPMPSQQHHQCLRSHTQPRRLILSSPHSLQQSHRKTWSALHAHAPAPAADPATSTTAATTKTTTAAATPYHQAATCLTPPRKKSSAWSNSPCAPATSKSS